MNFIGTILNFGREQTSLKLSSVANTTRFLTESKEV